MRSKKFALFMLPALLCLTFFAGRSRAGSPGAKTSTFGEWQTSGRIDNLQAICDANHPGTLCAEWCEGLIDPQPTGTICCVDGGLVNTSGARLSDCTYRIW